MKTQSNRRNFLQKAALATAGIFSANYIKAKNNENSTPSDTSNKTIETIHALHTTHGNFADKKIPADQIEQIKQACIRAANVSNMQRKRNFSR